MGIQVKDLGKLAEKFARNAGNAQGDYKDGVAGAGGKWESETAAAEPSYVQGVQAAIGRNAYGKGVRRSGGAAYQAAASTKGVERYPTGVRMGKDNWQKGFQPVAAVLNGVNLPPKGPRRSPQNQARANAVATALGAWKESQ